MRTSSCSSTSSSTSRWRATRNSTVVSLIRNLFKRLEIARDMAVHAPPVPDWVIDIHERTLAAVRSADFAVIDDVMDEHLAQLEQIWERETGRGSCAAARLPAAGGGALAGAAGRLGERPPRGGLRFREGGRATRRSAASAARSASREASSRWRRIADGWIVAVTIGARSLASSSPRWRVRRKEPSRALAAVAPSSTSASGLIWRSSSSSHGRQASTSKRLGVCGMRRHAPRT